MIRKTPDNSSVNVFPVQHKTTNKAEEKRHHLCPHYRCKPEFCTVVRDGLHIEDVVYVDIIVNAKKFFFLISFK